MKIPLHKSTFFSLLFILALAIIGFWLFFPFQKQAPLSPSVNPPIKLPVDIWPGNFWIIVADEMGYFEEEGLPVELIDISATFDTALDDLLQGRLDAHILAPFDVVRQNIGGVDLVVVLETDNSVAAEGIAAKPGITSLRDLKGKRVGVEVGSYLEFDLDVAMQNVDISDDQYTKVDALTDDLYSLYGRDEIDALVSWEPDLSNAIRDFGGQKIFNSSDIKGLSAGVLALRGDFINTRLSDVQRLVNAWHKAVTYIYERPEETYELVSHIDFASHSGQTYSKEEIRAIMEEDVILGLEDNLKDFSFRSGFESLYSSFQFVIRSMHDKEEINDFSDPSDILDARFIRSLP